MVQNVADTIEAEGLPDFTRLSRRRWALCQRNSTKKWQPWSYHPSLTNNAEIRSTFKLHSDMKGKQRGNGGARPHSKITPRPKWYEKGYAQCQYYFGSILRESRNLERRSHKDIREEARYSFIFTFCLVIEELESFANTRQKSQEKVVDKGNFRIMLGFAFFSL